MTRDLVALLIYLAAVGLVVAGAFALHAGLGLVACGVALGGVGYLVEGG